MNPKPEFRRSHSARKQGFTLIEMVGVLAIIAILAALLVPRIFSAIVQARYDNAVVSLNSMRTGAMDYFQHESFFPSSDTNFDATLVSKGYAERSFMCKIGDSPVVRTISATSAAGGARYTMLDGISVIADGTVVEVQLRNVAADDAYELSQRLDGPDMSQPDLTLGDPKGRVIYAAPVSGSVSNLFIYLAHK